MSLSLPGYLARPRTLWRVATRRVASIMPKGLYARSLLIVILPVVLLQSAIAWVFMERHWQRVTMRLSASVVSEIAATIDLYMENPTAANFKLIDETVSRRLGLEMELLPDQQLPPALPKPFFSILESALARQLSVQIRRPFWVDTVGRSRFVEIRIKLPKNVLRIITHRNQAYASNSHIFLMWMVGTSLVLLAVAIAFLRNQIRPILRLAGAAERFGKGRDYEFRPHGAREVRQAGMAFLEMKQRIERAMEQRTAMLNGVSHDLRTILTRFNLSLAVMPESPETEAMQADVNEMQRMLEAYLDFARGAGAENAETIDMKALLEQVRADAERHGRPCEVVYSGERNATVRPDAFKRVLTNLVSNAQRFGKQIRITGLRGDRFLTVHIDDDGPGIPEAMREDVFRPFMRLDEGRNQDEGNTGLGLAIARDIARAHGGDVLLAESPLGGLRATVRVPV